MIEVRRLTPSEAGRLTEALRTLIDFIAANVPADAIAARQKHGWARAQAALKLRPSTARNVNAITLAACWAWGFIAKNHQGGAPALAPAALLLAEIGLLDTEELPTHPTRQ
jgi:hypothetical protein